MRLRQCITIQVNGHILINRSGCIILIRSVCQQFDRATGRSIRSLIGGTKRIVVRRFRRRGSDRRNNILLVILRGVGHIACDRRDLRIPTGEGISLHIHHIHLSSRRAFIRRRFSVLQGLRLKRCAIPIDKRNRIAVQRLGVLGIIGSVFSNGSQCRIPTIEYIGVLYISGNRSWRRRLRHVAIRYLQHFGFLAVLGFERDGERTRRTRIAELCRIGSSACYGYYLCIPT